MKRQTVHLLCVISIWMSSCKLQDSDDTADTPGKHDEAHADAATSLKEQASSISIRSILEVLLEEAFDNTTEGISLEELRTLNQKLESERWKVTFSGESNLTIEGKQPKGALIRMRSYPLGANAVLVCQTMNEGRSTVETWLYVVRDRTVSKKQFLPVVSINDFYAKSDKAAEPQRYSGNVVLSLNEDGTLTYDLHTWMEDALANKKKIKVIAGVWDGASFKVKVTSVPKNREQDNGDNAIGVLL